MNEYVNDEVRALIEVCENCEGEPAKIIEMILDTLAWYALNTGVACGTVSLALERSWDRAEGK